MDTAVLAPTADVLRAVGVAETPVALAGGTTGPSYLAGSVVLKANQDEESTAWLGDVAAAIEPSRDFRLARPIRSLSGSWTVAGWAATSCVEGDHVSGRWVEILESGRALHRAIAHLPRPDFVDRRTDRWAIADRAVWGEAVVATPNQLEDEIGRLEVLLRPIEGVPQIVHSDLCGNALIAADLPPAIIDFSPMYRSAEYAEGILISDAVIWEEVPMSLAENWAVNPEQLKC
ncbi:MAG TPA: aminoglycoside phosphotransferase [Candidatus Nitrosotalea sp.]|nr:aminoglycoside phosphotransferase [Candidatus Nitrosotalea sp.]